MTLLPSPRDCHAMAQLQLRYPIAAARLTVLVCNGEMNKEKIELGQEKGAVSTCEIPDCPWCHTANWGLIWAHAIECGWSPCFNTTFDSVIQPHFQNTKLLDAILKSEVIQDKGEILVADNGARIFREFLSRLLSLENVVITHYLRINFNHSE